jgi:hypothetical protein
MGPWTVKALPKIGFSTVSLGGLFDFRAKSIAVQSITLAVRLLPYAPTILQAHAVKPAESPHNFPHPAYRLLAKVNSNNGPGSKPREAPHAVILLNSPPFVILTYLMEQYIVGINMKGKKNEISYVAHVDFVCRRQSAVRKCEWQ